MIVQYKTIIFHNDPEFSLKAISHIPKLFFEFPHILLRSSNWFRLLDLDHQEPWNFKDFLLMVVFPIMQISILFLVYFFILKVSSFQKKNIIKQKYFLVAISLSAITLTFLIGKLAPIKNQTEIKLRYNYADLLKQAEFYLKENQIDQALKYYRKASNQSIQSLTPYFQLGLIHQTKNNFLESNKNFQKVLKFDPNHQFALVNLADNFNSLGDYKNAEKNLKIAIRNQSPLPEAFDLLGQVYAKQNQLSNAEKMFKVTITLKPNYGNGHLNLAILYNKIGKKQQAIYHLKETVRLGVKNKTTIKLLNSYRVSLMELTP